MKFIKRVLFILFLVIAIVVGISAYNGYNMYKSVIEKIPIETMVKNIQSNDKFVSISEMPKDYVNAVIAVEDRRFYKHNGVDIISIGRAIVTDIKNMEMIEGGSTITQQIAKNNMFNQERKLDRKFAEIFELYVNTCYFGDGYYCIKDAAEGYFKKEPKDMDLNESTLLAGIPNAPSIYAPTKNPDLAKERQGQVIDKMIKNNYLTKEQAKSIGF